MRERERERERKIEQRDPQRHTAPIMWHWRCFGGRCCLAICSGRNMYKTCSGQSLACFRRPFDALPMRRASSLNIGDGDNAFRCRLKERAAHAFSGVSSRAARRVADASSVVSGRNLRPHWSLRVVWGECPTQQQDPLPAHEAENNSAIVTERGGFHAGTRCTGVEGTQTPKSHSQSLSLSPTTTTVS